MPSKCTRTCAWSWEGPGHALDLSPFGASPPADTIWAALNSLFTTVPSIPSDHFDADLRLRDGGGIVRVVGHRDGAGWNGIAVSVKPAEAQSLSQLRTVEDIVGVATWRVAEEGGDIWLSPSLYDLFGVDPDGEVKEIVESRIVPKIHDDDRHEVMQFIAGFGDGKSREIEFRAQVDGGERHFHVRVEETDGARVGVVADVSDVRRAEAAERNAETLFRTLAKAFPLGIYIERLDGTPEFANDHLLDLLGIDSPQKLDWQSLVHPEDYDDLLQSFEQWKRTGEQMLDSFRLVSDDGKVKHVESQIIRIETVDAPRYVSYVIDRTEFVNQQQSLRESQRQLEWSEQFARTGSWRSDLEGDVRWSRGLFELLGRDPDTFEVTKSSFLDHVHPDDLESTEEVIRQIYEGTGWDYELALQKASGDTIWVRSVGEYHEDGDKREVRGIIQDITTMRELEGRLRRAEKMQALGELAGGIAHDFNNLLANILGNAQLLIEGLEGPQREDCQEIIDTSRRCGELTNQLLAFSRRRPLASDPIEAEKAVGTVLKLLQHAVERDVSIEFVRPDFPLFIRGNTSQIENALLNVSLNAVQAMPDGGTLTIRIAESELHTEIWKPDFEVVDGPAVEIEISDDGVGIGHDHLKRVLEPFFTTRRSEGGTGLGLSMTYGTVRNHGGALSISSEPGNGTTVRLVFPAVHGLEMGTLASDTSDVSESLNLAGRKALIVDDEVGVRRVLKRQLTGLGLRVFAAGGNGKARELIEESLEADDRFDVAVVDLSLRDGPGTQTAKLVRESWPDAHIIIISGYDVRTALDHGHGFHVLQKPFTRQSLIASLVPLGGRTTT